MFVEFAIAVDAGLAAGSIALIGFGADSLIEALAGFRRALAVHRGYQDSRVHPPQSVGAQQLIATSFFVPCRLRHHRGCTNHRRQRSPPEQFGRDRPGRVHGTDDAPARARETKGGQQAELVRGSQGSQPDTAVRLPLVSHSSSASGRMRSSDGGWADPAAALVIAAVALKEGARENRAGGAKAVPTAAASDYKHVAFLRVEASPGDAYGDFHSPPGRQR